MFVRRLVTGVRSSCEASATSWRWACTDASSALIERSSASSIALKLLARRPISSSLVGSIRPLRSWVGRRARSASVSRLSGSTAAPATSRPSSAASAMPPTSSSTRIRRSGAAGCRLRSAAGRAARLARCAERLGEHAQVHAAHVHVAEERLAAACGERAGAASTGSVTFARGAQRAPCRWRRRPAGSRAPGRGRAAVSRTGCRRGCPVRWPPSLRVRRRSVEATSL